MWIAILLLALLFVAGLISTNYFSKKKFLAWFQSFCVKIRSPFPHSANSLLETKSDKKVEKRSAYNNNKVHELRSVFATFDKNSDGYITEQELRDSLNSIGMGMTEKEIADMMKKVDSDGDGLIDLDEFCESFDSLLLGGGEMSEEQELEEGDLKEAFGVFDGDKDGLITVKELGLVLSSLGFKEGKNLEDCKEMIRKIDMDGDGMVNFDEFKKMMKDGQHMLVPIS
ncbi:hypothetical protein ACH5RR_004354 [Cinchona calisaya]|uniref:EF-hand domain-containing protein n=1 Tax=Cinchona calisaya TaxID=153742 RepID=A0ABD3AXY3_9GENT